MDHEKGIYTLKSTTGEERDFKPDGNTLIDKSMEVGERIEVSLSKDNQPIAIRKVRSQNP
jgi:hypothetical protein